MREGAIDTDDRHPNDSPARGSRIICFACGGFSVCALGFDS